MAKIDEYLSKILSAVYGKDVRQTIHDSIKEINNESTATKNTVGTFDSRIKQLESDAGKYVKTVNGVAPDANGNVAITVSSGGSGGNVEFLDPEAGEVFTVAGGENTHTHSYTSIVTTAATCTTAGVRTYTCFCGDTYTETIAATGHNYVDGVCTVCGAEDPTYNTDVTLSSISATYTGGNVAVGTAVTDLTGITVTAHYSDGSTEAVAGYTLSGEITEGSNTITVSYGGMTTTFVVTGEAENTNLGDYPVYLETIDGVEYIVTTDPTLVRGHMSATWLAATSYANDTYTCFNASPFGFNSVLDNTVAEPYGGVIPFAEGTNKTGSVLLNYAEEGEFCGGPNKAWWRLYNDLGDYDVHDYYWNKYGVLKLALKSGLNKKTIDPSLITSISIQQNDDTWQYAQFKYSDPPASNIYGGVNTLTFVTGGNLNLSAEITPCASMHTNNNLAIKFKPGTFTDFTLDAVKAFLTEHPLTFIY